MAMTPRAEPDKLAAEVRKSHFEEIYQPFTPQQAQRHRPPAVSHVWEHSILQMDLPLCITIPQWIELVKVRNIAAAVALSHQIMPAGDHRPRHPQDRRCEGACTCAMKAGSHHRQY